VPQFKSVLESQSAKLRQALALRIRRSPKRRALSEESDIISRYANGGKRMKLSSSQVSSQSDDPPIPASSPPSVNGSPSPSVASTFTTDDKSPFITVSMLRALTKNVKQKYGNIG